jgi:hypothetical protein
MTQHPTVDTRMKLALTTEQSNAQSLRIVVRAALEDLAMVRHRHGEDSPAYAAQTSVSMAFIRSDLQAVLTAALARLEEAGHDERRHTTGTD